MTVYDAVEKINEIEDLKDRSYRMQTKAEALSCEFRYFEEVVSMLDEYKDSILSRKIVER